MNKIEHEKAAEVLRGMMQAAPRVYLEALAHAVRVLDQSSLLEHKVEILETENARFVRELGKRTDRAANDANRIAELEHENKQLRGRAEQNA